MTSIGFIGTGNMGGPMARNLLKSGFKLHAFDVVASSLKAIVDAGAEAAGSAVEAAATADIVITMLPAGKHVASVYLGDEGIIAATRPGTLLIDCSTIDVKTARDVARSAQNNGKTMLDAPVSGGTAGAEAGTLTFMVGGPAEGFEKSTPILEKMGRTVVHTGAAGTGQAAKICNNMILGISMIAVGEAFVLAEKLGLDAQKLFDVSSKSSGQCWSLTSYCPVPGPVPTSPANRDYKPGFAADLMLKDLSLSQEAAMQAGVDTALGYQATLLYEAFAKAGEGGTDFSGIIKMIRARQR
ncbi:3-hydroxyisobutyrate dehydrogenase [Hypericibacter terrae]|uniref:3-hydroxyisobutyrate dehydrogenase n=1 Tax=Hypericibacter terrae TaxID=2602015 RepID=A0A5J6MG36_9PROT|nr:3-hydroxyisobutyrate dehydrogenase [Hypericibacter terrae]QEX16422.1 3-hydroxyisobutyrate dehydrogenase [Hypericibacter terrae]